MSQSNPRLWWWVVLLLLALTWLGATRLDANMLWVDEVFSIGNVGGYQGAPYNPAQVWDSLSHNSPQHVPGYFFVLSGWAALVGWSPFALRALSLLFGLLAVAWTYRLGANWLSRRAGIYAAVLLAVGPFYIYFTHELRMYTMIAFLTVFVLWIYWRIATRVPDPALREWAALFVGALALLYTHLFGALVLAAIGLYHLLFVRKNRRWVIVVVLLGIVGVSILPWLQVLLKGVRNVGLGEEPMPPGGIFEAMLHLFSSGNMIELALLAGLAGVALLYRRRGAREVWFFLVVIFILTLVANQARPMISEGRTRYLIHLWPLLALLAALGLTALERWRFRWLALLAVWLLVGLRASFDSQFLIDMDGPRYVKDYPPLREIAAEINLRADSDDLLVGFSRQWHVFNLLRFFTPGDFYLRNLVSDYHFITLPETRTPEEVTADLDVALGTRLTVWLAYEPIIPAEDLAPYRAILDERYILCDTPVQQPMMVIERYDLAGIDCLDRQPPDSDVLHYDAGIDLRAVRSDVDAASGQLLVAGAWSVDAQVPVNTYSASFKLWDQTGAFVAQSDRGLRGAGFGWQLATLPLADVPPGEYALTVAVYDWSSGERLSATSASGEQGDELPVAQVQIGAGSRTPDA